MRARHIKRAAPVALLASLTLIATPGVTFADPAPENPRQHVQIQVAEATEEAPKSLDEQIESAQKALERAQKQAESAQSKLDNTTAAHDKARNDTAAARKALRTARTDVDRKAAQLRKAEKQVKEHSGFSVEGIVDSVMAFLGSDVAGSVSDELDDKREAVGKAEKKLSGVEREETKAERARINAEKANEQATEKRDKAQSELDGLNERKRAEEDEQAEAPADGGGAAPAAPEPTPAPGVVKPAEGRFTSGYGARWGTTHYGVDIANEIGTPIRSLMSGTVISSGPASGFGLWVRVQHDNGLITVYGHINESLVSIGQQVEAGQEIATIGNRGQSTGPHLHLEIIENGVKIDPLPWLNEHGIVL